MATFLTVLKIILLCVGGLIVFAVLLVLLLSFFRIKLTAAYDDGFLVQLRYLFIKKRLYPPKKKKKREASPQKSEKAPEGSENVFEFTFRDYIEILRLAFMKLIKRIEVDSFYLNAKIAEGDAAKTALVYGEINAAVYPLVGILYNSGKLKNASVQIAPDFTAERSVYKARTELTVRGFTFLRLFASAAIYIYRKRKGGHTNERK